MERLFRRAKVRAWSSEMVVGGGVVGEAREEVEEVARWWVVGFMYEEEDFWKAKPRDSRAWMTAVRALVGTRM